MGELVPDVHLVDSSVGCNTYLIIDNGITLVDTGLRGNTAKIYEYIEKLGYTPRDIKRIIITHAHLDHINCLPRLKEDTGAQVMVGEKDADIVDGKKPLHRMKGMFGVIFSTLRVYYRYKPIKVDVLLKDGDMIDVLGGLRVVLLGGHSPGNIGLYSASRRLFFSSDSIRVIDNHLIAPHPKFTENMPGAIQSIKRISELDFDIMLPGHGSPVMHDASAKVKELYHEVKH
jgi:glyoxylase-like metal-dependent hydrolase (beta-lactamase superfamily II)